MGSEAGLFLADAGEPDSVGQGGFARPAASAYNEWSRETRSAPGERKNEIQLQTQQVDERQRWVRLLEQRLELERSFGVASLPRAKRPEPLSSAEQLAALEAELQSCCRCGLAKDRTHLVFGAGHPEADLMFVGEAPGHEEDRQGKPFVGAAGQLLSKIIKAIGCSRDDVYIGNVLKCHPPGNRTPAPAERAHCLPFLRRQIAIIRPRIIVALGAVAAQALLDTEQPIGRLRGRFHEMDGVRVMPTYHPAYLLRNEQGKRPVWEDMKKVRDALKRS